MSAPVPSAEPLVKVEGIHTYYGKSHILHGVALTVVAARSSVCWAATASARAQH